MIYVPFPDWLLTAQCLDDPTIEIEIDNIVNLLENLNETEAAQPVDDRLVEAWRGYETQLAQLGLVCCDEVEARLHQNPRRTRLSWHLECVTSGEFSMDMPPWVGSHEVHRSHQSQLIALNPLVYAPLFPGVPDNLEVVWPD